MSYNRKQFEKVIRDTLVWAEKNSGLKLLSDSAVNLLLGTAAQESEFGTHLMQIGGGPALGCFQVEPTTFALVVKAYKNKMTWLTQCNSSELRTDLCLSIIIARLLYHSIKEPLPAADDIAGMASYWNGFYNRNPDKGTDAEFIQNYNHFVKEKQ